MSSNCTDTTNTAYELFWFDYFVSLGYIDSSSVNLYAPYGKCTPSSLWITYLINIIHFFLLSSGVLYILTSHRHQIGLWWPFITWMSSFIFLIAAIIFYMIFNSNIKIFSILIIGFQISSLIILSISIFIVIKVIFTIKYRYQRILSFFIIILLLFQIGCFTGQVIITLHCAFNLQFASIALDYSYLSAIIAAIGTIISTILMDHIFIWFIAPENSSKVSPAPMNQETEIHHRATSPIDPVILDCFQRQCKVSLYHIYSNTDQTRHFQILPTSQQSIGRRTSIIPFQNVSPKVKKHDCLTPKSIGRRSSIINLQQPSPKVKKHNCLSPSET